MHTTQDHPWLQAHLDEFFARIASSPELQDQLSPEDLPQLLEAGLSHVLNTALKTERQLHLESHPQDRANGYAPKRTLQVGATSVALDRPRTRQGFYPAVLPKHQRHLPEAYHQLLRNILLGARSFSAARRTLQALGLGCSAEQVEGLLEELHQEAKSFFSRPLGPDWLCLFIEAKLVELKDDHDVVKQAVHFLVVGIGLDGKKEVLTATGANGSIKKFSPGTATVRGEASFVVLSASIRPTSQRNGRAAQASASQCSAILPSCTRNISNPSALFCFPSALVQVCRT